jgi:hypothetical protein
MSYPALFNLLLFATIRNSKKNALHSSYIVQISGDSFGLSQIEHRRRWHLTPASINRGDWARKKDFLPISGLMNAVASLYATHKRGGWVSVLGEEDRKMGGGSATLPAQY